MSISLKAILKKNAFLHCLFTLLLSMASSSCAQADLSSDPEFSNSFPASSRLDPISAKEAAQNPPSDLYPIPLSETESLIYEFLSQENIEFRRVNQKLGRIMIFGIKGSEKWRIILNPRSTLTTEVNSSYMKNGEFIKGGLEKLRNHILKGIQESSSGGENISDFIPPLVLAKIESVVCLEAVLPDKRIQFSGFIVDEAGLILATAHDLIGRQKLNVTLYDGRKAPGVVIEANRHWDLALIKVGLEAISHISLERGRNLLGVGEKIFTVGCPINLRGTVFPGIVNGPPRRVNDRIYWQVNMKIHPGSSGSPVFDAQGNLVAVVKGRFRGIDSLGFLIPFETIVEFVKEVEIQ